MTAAAARRLPAQLVESGPAAGALAAAAMGRQVDETRLLSLDMGGTTAKATFILDGVVPLALEAEIGAGVMVANRLNRGGGYLLSLPSIDLVEVGAGGGSLVWIGVPGQDSRTDIRADIRPVSETTGPRGRDAGGVLCVGPQSAGAAPGPACYAAGGTAPTLTDANVVLGYLNPHHLLGGELRLDAEAARCAVTEQVADPLGLSVEAAAYGAHAIAVASMVWAVRAVSAERGHDPRAAALVAFGGNGPLHAAAVAQELGIPRVLVPPSPGVFSAFGLLAAEVEHHFLHTHLRRLDQLEELSAVRNVASGMAETALATLGAEGYHPESVELRWAADLRYLGQSFELTVAVAQPLHSAFDTEVVAALERAFGAAHERTYGHSAPGEPVELVNLRLVARGRSAAPRGLPRHAAVEDSDARERRTRRAYFGADGGWQETPVLERGALAGAAQAGPLIVEEYDATTLVPPGWQARLGAQGSIVLERLAA
jgi:N-methylhydantoinase A